MKTYDRLSRLNHWSVALLFVAMLIAGLTLEYGSLPKTYNLALLTAHKATGVLLLLWVIWRVIYRLIQGFAAPASAMPRWQEVAATSVHYLLLISILAMPLSGLTMSLYSGKPTDVFGLFSIPPIDKIEAAAIAARIIHKWVAYGFIAVLFLHIAGALKHHFYDKDQTLRRMVSGRTGQP